MEEGSGEWVPPSIEFRSVPTSSINGGLPQYWVLQVLLLPQHTLIAILRLVTLGATDDATGFLNKSPRILHSLSVAWWVEEKSFSIVILVNSFTVGWPLQSASKLARGFQKWHPRNVTSQFIGGANKALPTFLLESPLAFWWCLFAVSSTLSSSPG